MYDYDGLREIVVKGLKEYLNCPVIRSNQNSEPPEYPYISYTVTTLKSENKGTYGEYSDGKERKPFTQTWSITALSNDDSECVLLANKAHEWLERAGYLYLSDNKVIVQSVGNVTNRDNFLTVEYEYRKGFDVVFWMFDEVESIAMQAGYIETVDFDNREIIKSPTTEELTEKLATRLTGR